MTPDPNSPWCTVPQAAAWARCSVKVIYGAIRRGQLRAVRVGRTLRVHREWIEAWLQAAEIVNPSAPGAPHPFHR